MKDEADDDERQDSKYGEPLIDIQSLWKDCEREFQRSWTL